MFSFKSELNFLWKRELPNSRLTLALLSHYTRSALTGCFLAAQSCRRAGLSRKGTRLVYFMRGRIWLAALLFIYNLHELGIGAMGTNPTGAETAVLFKHRVHLHPRWAPIPFIARARRQWVSYHRSFEIAYDRSASPI